MTMKKIFLTLFVLVALALGIYLYYPPANVFCLELMDIAKKKPTPISFPSLGFPE